MSSSFLFWIFVRIIHPAKRLHPRARLLTTRQLIQSRSAVSAILSSIGTYLQCEKGYSALEFANSQT